LFDDCTFLHRFTDIPGDKFHIASVWPYVSRPFFVLDHLCWASRTVSGARKLSLSIIMLLALVLVTVSKAPMLLSLALFVFTGALFTYQTAISIEGNR